jgi:hypothetical protein
MDSNFYIYVYLDNRKIGVWEFKDIVFKNKPFYIGKGKCRRINHHLQPKSLSKSTIKSNTINKIIKDTGELPIHYKVFENLTFEESNIIEIEMIKHFGRIDNNTGILTNMTDGGEGFKNMVFSINTKKKMSESSKGTKTYSNNGMSKIVEQYTLDGILINVFQSLREASEKNNVDFKNISSCCRGKTKSAYGYIWKYVGKSYNPQIKIQANDRKKKVYQYTLNGEFIKEFESETFARKITKISHISAVCLGQLNFAGGYQWRYEKFDKLLPLTSDKTKNIFRYIK